MEVDNRTAAIAEAVQPFVCGGLSAMFASACIHPIDLTKVRIQLMGQGTKGAVPSPAKVVADIVKAEGFTGLYSGLTAALTRQATYGTARIGLHRAFSNKLEEINEGNAIPFYMKAVSGLCSGAIAVCIGTPFDVALVRMQNDGSRPATERRGYKNVFDALMRISREEGVLNLWRGLAPNVLRGMSMNVGMMACYDEAKEMILNITHDPDPKKPSLQTKLGSAAIAGFCCAFLSLPFDMVKSRLQNMRADPTTGRMPYKGLTDCFVKITTQEGPLAFWKGFSAYYGRCAPHSMIILLTIEHVTSAYRDFFKLEDDPSKLVTAGRFTSTGTVHSAASGDSIKGSGDDDEADH